MGDIADPGSEIEKTTMPRAWKPLLLGMAIACAFVACGYVAAAMSLAACSTRTYALLEERGAAVGHDLLGMREVLRPGRVTSRVIGPFLVESTAVLPRTAHGTVHMVRYIALPGWQHLLVEDEAFLA